MALRNIVFDGDPVLLKKSRAVEVFDERLAQLLDDLGETMHEANGLGLAAPQVGVLRRVAVVYGPDDRVVELVNPEIIERNEEEEGAEGCLSFPDLWGVVPRPTRVKVRAFDRNGSVFEIEGEGITARAFCHEIDHLDGVVFTSRVTRFITGDEAADMRDDESNPEATEKFRKRMRKSDD